MKKLKFLGVMAMATVLLTSCLDGGSNESSLNGFGVIDLSMDAMANVAYIDDYTQVYSPQFKDLSEGDCIYFSSTLKRDDPANDGSKKYWTVSDAIVLNKLDKSDEFGAALDTANIIPNEIAALDAGLLRAITEYSFTIKNYFFIGSSHEKVAPDQNNRYIMQYDPNQEPQEVDGKRVYDFFVRIVKESDGKGITGSNAFNYVFNTRGYFKILQAKEKAAGKELLNIRINYLKSYDEATNTKTWAKSQVYSTMIPKES